MHARGYAAIGVAEICAAADVRKGSFYHFFPSKQALTVAVIDDHWACQRAQWHTLLSADTPALQRVEALLRAQAAAQADSLRAVGAVRGCLLGNLALELSTTDEVVRRRLEDAFAEQVDLLAAVLAEAAAAGEIPPQHGTPTQARALLAQLEGMVMFAKLANDPAVLDALWATARPLVGA